MAYLAIASSSLTFIQVSRSRAARVTLAVPRFDAVGYGRAKGCGLRRTTENIETESRGREKRQKMDMDQAVNPALMQEFTLFQPRSDEIPAKVQHFR
ncbi:hypothetical protein ABD76_17120 [Paenibacillus dendritiformis]|nr:hypothetical protein [Paenibacillus dendritiformis]